MLCVLLVVVDFFGSGWPDPAEVVVVQAPVVEPVNPFQGGEALWRRDIPWSGSAFRELCPASLPKTHNNRTN